MENLKDLLCHQLKALYCVEDLTINYFPLIIEKIDEPKLKNALKFHLKETRAQISRLDAISKDLKFNNNRAEFTAISGLFDQMKEFMINVKNSNVFNAGLIAELQRIEHFEICAYGTAVCYAKELGLYRIASLLQETLNEEYGTNDKLSLLAKVFLNYRAVEQV
ncbi:YciE/YciF ferroxidase family protein [Winogradskyella ursingii]|uniref:YciE/YciF ferroxidase family protein n=1 Tax=Winogradskyella ursingii TaxID=2686079 RepID=UPI0015C73DBF|nr:DUF892 family protein [Winogradskyella ursingii]